MNGTRCVIAALILLPAAVQVCAAAEGSDPALDKYYNANALCRRGLYPLAIKDFEAFLAAHPKHAKVPLAQWGLAICYYSSGEMGKAAALFEKLVGNPHVTDQEQLHNLWGSSLVGLGKQAEAVKTFEWTVKNAKTPARKADALAGLTQAHSLLKDWAAAVRASDELIKLAPASPHADLARYQGGVARLNLEQPADAARVFQGLIGAAKDAELVHQSVYRAAECFVKLKKPAEAIKMYETAATTKTGEYSELAYFNLGLLQFETGDYPAAITTLKGFSKKYPDSALSADVSLFLGRSYLESKKYREAVSIFEGILSGLKGPELKGRKKQKRPPGSPLVVGDSSAAAQATLWLIRTYARQGKHETVRELLAPVIRNYRNDPVSTELYYELATADMESGEFASAAKNFAESEGGKAPLPSESLRLRAFCLYRDGKWRDSLPLCDSFLEKFPDNPHKAEVLFLKGEDLMALVRMADAIGAFEAALAAGPDEAKVRQSHLRIAQAYYHQKKWAECVESLGPLLAADPPSVPDAAAKKPRKVPRKKPSAPEDRLYAQVWFMAGDCYFRLQQWPKAIEALVTFLDRHPAEANAEEAQYNLALAYQKAEKPAEAIAMLKPFLHGSKRPDAGAETLRIRALVDLGRLQYETGDYQQAEGTLKRAGDHPDAIYYLGWVAMKRKDPYAAVQHFGAMTQRADSPLATDAALQRAVLEYRSGHYAEAEATLTALAKKFPRNAKGADHVDTVFYLGLCRARQKNYDKAVENFSDVARRSGENPRVPEAMYWQAWCEKQRGNVRQAESLYTAFLAKYPAGKLAPDVTLELAELRFSQYRERGRLGKTKGGRREAAPDCAAIAATLRPLLAEDGKTPATGELRNRVLYLLGWCLFEQGEMGPSARSFETLIAAEEEAAKADRNRRMSNLVPSACFQAGEARRRMQEFGPAKELFEKAARLRGTARQADQDDMLLRLAQLQAINGQWRESLQSAQLLLKSFPDSTLKYEALFSIGWAHENQKQYGPALSHYRKVTAANVADGVSARAQFQIGECYFAQGQHDGAISEFNLVITKYGFDQWSSLALLGMGRCFKAQGKTMQARSYLDDIILKYPKTTAAELAVKLLATMEKK